MQYDIVFRIRETNEGVSAHLNYWTARISDEVAAGLATRFNGMLLRILESPSHTIGDLDPLLQSDQGKLVARRLARLKEDCLEYSNTALNTSIPVAILEKQVYESSEDTESNEDSVESDVFYPGPIKLGAISVALSLAVFLAGLVGLLSILFSHLVHLLAYTPFELLQR